MKVRVYTDYDPIRILRSFDPLKADIVSKKACLTGTFHEVEESEIPSDRTDRDCWTHKNGKFEVDEVKRQARLEKKEGKDRKKNAVLAKLKITEEEFLDLIKGGE